MAETTATRSRLKPDASAELDGDVPEIRIFGPPASDFTVIPSSTLQLLCGVGEVDDDEVIVPYLQMRLLKPGADGVEGPDFDEAFKATIPLENLTFLLLDMSRDVQRVMGRLHRLSAGPIAPEPHRIGYSVDCLRKAAVALLAAATTLEDLAIKPTSVPAQAAKAKPEAVPKPKRPRIRKASAS